MTGSDPLLERLAAADPAASEAAPPPGSPRYLAIQETAMTTTTEHPRFTGRPARRLRLVPAAVAATVAVAASVVGVSSLGGETPTASAAQVLRGAAAQTAAAKSLRAVLVAETGGRREVSRAEVAGSDVRISNAMGPGTSIVYLAGKEYDVDASGNVDAYVPKPDEVNAPFAESSAAVVKAALAGGATEVGRESVRGQDATRYRVDLDAGARDRLKAVPIADRTWFELEYPRKLRRMEVWVGDGVIRRIALQSGRTTTTCDYYDFGADVDIQPPAGG